MYCRHCGVHLEATAAFCHACGKPTGMPELPDRLKAEEAAAITDAPIGVQGNPVPPGLGKRAFYRRHFRCRRSLRTAGILCYVSAALVLLTGFVSDAGAFSLIDVSVLLFFGGLMHLVRSRFCAVVLCVYALLCVLLLVLGITNGWLLALLAIIAAVLGVRGTFCFARDWKRYCDACGKVH